MSDPMRDQTELLRAALGRTRECPPLDALTAARPETAVKRHVTECPHCRAELALFQQFESAQPQPDEAADLAWLESALASPAGRPVVTSKPQGGRLRTWFELLFTPSGLRSLSLAAAMLLLLATAGIFLRPGGGVRPVAPEEPTVFRSSQFRAISPAGDLDQAPTQLHWEAVPGAASYHVRLMEVDGTEIWSADALSTSVDFPANIAQKLMFGRAFQWEAAARDSAGRQMAKTNLQTFHIIATRH